MSNPTCKIRHLTFGEGSPKICVPLIARDKIELEERAAALHGVPCDVVEWRADYYPALTSETQIREAFAILKNHVEDRLILFTLRSRSEGGEKDLTGDEYRYINRLVLRYGSADMMDVELSSGDSVITELVTKAHEHGVRVILSAHDFRRTPPAVEMIRTLRKMQELGADLAKLAVMPNSRNDVLCLMQATNDMMTQYATCPLITVAMGKEGLVSRIAGETFGSCMTFASNGEASAPGQIDAMDLSMILQILHHGQRI